METITIGAINYDSLATVDEADAYLAGDFSRSTNWAALDTSSKQRSLVSATRMIVPRVADGANLTTVPANLRDGATLLAYLLTQDPDGALAEDPSTGSNIKQVGAGSAAVTFFSPTAGTAFPKAVNSLVAQYTGGSVSSGVALLGSDQEDPRFDPNLGQIVGA